VQIAGRSMQIDEKLARIEGRKVQIDQWIVLILGRKVRKARICRYLRITNGVLPRMNTNRRECRERFYPRIARIARIVCRGGFFPRIYTNLPAAGGTRFETHPCFPSKEGSMLVRVDPPAAGKFADLSVPRRSHISALQTSATSFSIQKSFSLPIRDMGMAMA
jgi:hypothetical protein